MWPKGKKGMFSISFTFNVIAGSEDYEDDWS